MHTAKRTQEVADAGPSPFDGVDMRFADALTIIIACPFLESARDFDVLAVRFGIANPFIGIDLSVSTGICLDVCA